MEFSTVAVGGHPAPHETDLAAFIGFVMRLAVQAQAASGDIVDRCLMAHALGQGKLYFNGYGQCVGYVLWAHWAPAVERRVIETGNIRLHASEWSEGGEAWIVDLVVPFGSLKYVLDDLRDHVFRDAPQVTYLRYKNGETIPKRIARNARSHFFCGRGHTVLPGGDH